MRENYARALWWEYQGKILPGKIPKLEGFELREHIEQYPVGGFMEAGDVAIAERRKNGSKGKKGIKTKAFTEGEEEGDATDDEEEERDEPKDDGDDGEEEGDATEDGEEEEDESKENGEEDGENVDMDMDMRFEPSSTDKHLTDMDRSTLRKARVKRPQKADDDETDEGPPAKKTKASAPGAGPSRPQHVTGPSRASGSRPRAQNIRTGHWDRDFAGGTGRETTIAGRGEGQGQGTSEMRSRSLTAYLLPIRRSVHWANDVIVDVDNALNGIT
jgi:hypothetical protein